MPTAVVKQRPVVGNPFATVTIDLNKADLGQLAKKVAAAKTPQRKTKPPGTTLVLPLPNLTEENAKQIPAALAKLAGVDARASTVDLTAKAVNVKLLDKGGARFSEIKKALEAVAKPAPVPPPM